MANLTSVELKAIQEQIGAEQLLVKKFNDYATSIQDTELKAQCKDIASRHQEHLNLLMGCLG